MSSRESSFVFTLEENPLLQRLQSYRQRKKFTDITITVGNKKFAAHRIALKDSLLERWITKNRLSRQYKCKLDQQFVSPEIVEDLLNFFYTASITLTTENVYSLVIAAEHLEMTALLEACENFLNDSVWAINVFDLLLFSDKHKLARLRQCCVQYLNEHSRIIFTNTEIFKHFSVNDMETVILAIDTEQFDQEVMEVVIESVITWTDVNFAQRVKSLGNALKNFSLSKLSKQFLVNNLSQQKVIKESPIWRELVIEAIAKTSIISENSLYSDQVSIYSEYENISHDKQTDYEEEKNNAEDGNSEKGKVKQTTNEKKHNETVDHVNQTEIPKNGKNMGDIQVYCFSGDHPKTPHTVSCMDVSTGKWQKVANMTSNKWYFGGAAIGSKVYLCGHLDGDEENDMEMFDCLTHTWTKLAPMPQRRKLCAAAVLDGYVYVTGGQTKADEPVSSVYRYNIQTNRWETVKSMIYERYGHQLIELNGCLYAIAGEGRGLGRFLKAEVFNPSTDQWTEIAETKYTHHKFGATSHGGKIYICSERFFEVYSPETNSWKEFEVPKGFGGYYFFFNYMNRKLVSVNDKLLLIGGRTDRGGTASVFSYDPITDQWAQLPDMDTARWHHSSFVINLSERSE